MNRASLKGQKDASHSERRERVASTGCFDRSENLRIYDKWFTGTRPRDALLSWLDHRLNLTAARICDVGCAYGMHVLLGAAGSYGIELESYEVEFARSIGIEVHERDVLTDDLSDLPKADAIMALALIEHVDSPHILLRKLHGLLEENGLLVLETPRRPPLRLMERLPIFRRAFSEHDDHINSFTDSTMRFFCARAGFEVLWIRCWSKPLVNSYRISPRLSGIFPFSLVANGLIVVARKTDPWEYPPKSTRRAANNERGYVAVGQQFPGQTVESS